MNGGESGGPPAAPGRSSGRRRFADLPFAVKIFSLPVLAAVSFVLVLAVTVSSGHRSEALMEEIGVGHVPALLLRRDLEEGLATLQRTLQDAAAAQDSAVVEETDALHAQLLKRLEEARANATLDPAELAAVDRAYRDYYRLAVATTRAIIEGAGGAALTADLQRMTAAYVGIRDQLRKNTAQQQHVMETHFEEARADQARSVRLSVAIIVASLVLLVGISLVTTRNLTRPLGEAVAVAGRIAAGDLAADLGQRQRVSRDEVGTLLASLARMSANLRGMIFQVQQSSEEVSRASSSVATAYAQLNAGAEAQCAQAEASSAAIDQMGASIRSVAGNAATMAGRAEAAAATVAELGASVQSVAQSAESLSAAVEQTSSSIDEMGRSIGEIARVSGVQLESARAAEADMQRIAGTIASVGESLREADRIAGESRSLGHEGAAAAQRASDSMQKMTATVQRTASSVREVSSHSTEIESIVAVIEEIADQTNLLALNAAIIAAQAGEHGRGFSVVAGEVRRLADRSMKSAREIGEQIRTIIVKTREAVAVAEETLRETQESAALTRVAGEAITKILAGTDRTAEIVGHVNESGREQGRISEQATGTMRKLGEISAQVSRAAAELQAASGQIRASAASMSGVSQHVVRATGEQAAQSLSVVKEVREMSTLIRQVSTATEEQRLGGASMTTAIAKIAAVATENLEAARHLAETTRRLTGEAERLSAATGAFRT